MRAYSWRRATKSDERSIGRILSIARSAIKSSGRMDVFASGSGRNRLVAVVSRLSDSFPGIGCYLYAVGAHHASAERALDVRIKARPTKVRTIKGNLRQREWRTSAAFPGHAAVSGDQMQRIPGLAD